MEGRRTKKKKKKKELAVARQQQVDQYNQYVFPCLEYLYLHDDPIILETCKMYLLCQVKD